MPSRATPGRSECRPCRGDHKPRGCFLSHHPQRREPGSRRVATHGAVRAWAKPLLLRRAGQRSTVRACALLLGSRVSPSLYSSSAPSAQGAPTKTTARTWGRMSETDAAAASSAGAMPAPLGTLTRWASSQMARLRIASMPVVCVLAAVASARSKVPRTRAAATPAAPSAACVEFIGHQSASSSHPDSACLNSDRNADAVRPVSQWQARPAIYQTSVERWRNYEP